MYTETVMDHFRNPRNVGSIENADGVGQVGNPKCGDIMKIYLKINDDIIEDVKFETFGCGSAIASSSMATELIKGKSIDDAVDLSNKAVIEALGGLPPVKVRYWQNRQLNQHYTTTLRKQEKQSRVWKITIRKKRKISTVNKCERLGAQKF
jgi:nitrogen fixation NifU-like protein